jgi:hypothetical protein
MNMEIDEKYLQSVYALIYLNPEEVCGVNN